MTFGKGEYNHQIINTVVQGNPTEVATISTLSLSSNVVTATTRENLPADWKGTMSIGIIKASNPLFNGLFQATITGTNTFTYPLYLPNMSGTGGKAASDNASAILAKGSSHITLTSDYFPGGPGARIYRGSVQAQFIYQETGYEPVIEISACLNPTSVQSIYVADSTGVPGIRVDNTIGPCGTAIDTTADGPINLGPGAYNTSSTTLPSSFGARGISRGELFAKSDDSRRAFGPTVAPEGYLNLASQAPSAWHKGSCGIAGTTITAPDGTLGAGYETSGHSACFSKGVALKTGDSVIFGAWVRLDSGASGFSGSTLWLNGSVQFTGPRNSWFSSRFATSSLHPDTPYAIGDWKWIASWALANTSGTFTFYGSPPSGGQVSFYAPTLVVVPATANLSLNEIAEMALHLQSFRSDAAPGQVSLLRGEQFKADSIQVGDGPTISSGLGPPKGSASPGSIYLRRDGSSGSAFYIYENGAWKAQF
jgi:hypothetical protein